MVDNYLKYLSIKYLIMDGEEDKCLKLNECNTINDVDIIKKRLVMLDTDKKLKDSMMVKLTRDVFEIFRCYEINSLLEDDTDIVCKKITMEKAEEIYLHYKKYKCSSNNVNETETYLILKQDIDTDDTYYVDSCDNITTKQLKDRFGDFLNSGNDSDKYRYEYRFEFITCGKRYKFVLYDYLNSENKFNEIDDIYWHISSNTKKMEVIEKFKLILTEEMCC
jgi:hypothetical protein